MRDRKRRERFPSETFGEFQHLLVIEFKMLGELDGTHNAPRWVVDELMEPAVAGISCAAVAAGAVASLALTLVLLSLGAGSGFAVVSPCAHSGVSATTFEIGTGLYFIVMAMISSAVGGYLAGRLRNPCEVPGNQAP